MKISIFRFALPALIFSASAQASITYDLVGNFNAPSNPDAFSSFSYGAGATPGAFAADSTLSTTCFASYGTGVGACSYTGAYPTGDFHSWNDTGALVQIGTVLFQLTDITMDPTGSAGDIVRFTVPITGTYSLSGNFEANDTNHSTTNVFVYVNSTQSYSDTVGGPGSVDPFSLSGLSLTAGDTIDFIITSGGGTDYLSTGLNGSIIGPDDSSVPEPGSIFLVAGSLALLLRRHVGIRRLRTRNN